MLKQRGEWGKETALGWVYKFRIRIRSEQPTLIENSEVIDVFGGEESKVMDRLRVMLNRSSYMVNGPNREIMWAVDQWSYGRESWTCTSQGKSRLRAGAKPI